MAASTLQRLANDRGVSMDDIADAVRALPVTGPVLSHHERGVLTDLGVDVESTSVQPLLVGMLRRRQLEEQCLTAEQAAKLLGCEPSRVRQRLAGPSRSLLGFYRRSRRREWLLPRFQFDLGLHDLHGWVRLVRALPAASETSPTVMVSWLTDPQNHLGGRSRTEHVAAGGEVTELLKEAAAFGQLP